MDKIHELYENIEEVRKLLNSLTKESTNLTDPEITDVSEMLDRLLNEYYELMRRKHGKHFVYTLLT